MNMIQEKKQRQMDMMNSYELESTSAKGNVFAKSNIRNSTMQGDSRNKEIENQIVNIETKLKKATEFRQSILNGKEERLSFYKNKVQ